MYQVNNSFWKKLNLHFFTCMRKNKHPSKRKVVTGYFGNALDADGHQVTLCVVQLFLKYFFAEETKEK